MQIISQAGDTLDQCLYRETGQTNLVELTLEHNPGLASHGPVLPAGVRIDVPNQKKRQDRPNIRPLLQLWS